MDDESKNLKVDLNDGVLKAQRELFQLQLKNDNIPEFPNKWDAILNDVIDVSESTLECVFSDQMQKSARFRKDFKKYGISAMKQEFNKDYKKHK